MTYIVHLDPENDVDGPSYEAVLSALHEEFHENDQDAIFAAMADYMTGPRDGYAEHKIIRTIRERADSILQRHKERLESLRGIEE